MPIAGRDGRDGIPIRLAKVTSRPSCPYRIFFEIEIAVSKAHRLAEVCYNVTAFALSGSVITIRRKENPQL
jgi:hypothetical protein